MAAKLIVQLENGESFEATEEDLARFGFVDPHQVTRRFNAWLRGVHPEVEDLTCSPLNPFRYAVECAAHYPEMPDQAVTDAARSLLGAALSLHLISEHAIAGLPGDPFDLHQHEHDGPGTIRNHDRGEANYDPDKLRAALHDSD